MNQITKQFKSYFFKNFWQSLLAVSVFCVLLGYLVGYGAVDCECEVEAVVSSEGESVLEVDSVDVLGVESRDVLLSEGEYVSEAVEVCTEVAGAVINPGMYCFEGDSVKVAELVKKAGGYRLDNYASRYVSKVINLAKSLHDGEKVYVPFEQEVVCDVLELSYGTHDIHVSADVGAISIGNEDGEGQTTDDVVDDTNACIDLNTASVGDFDELDGVGLATAEAIVAGRPYSTTDGLLDVSGIGDAKYESILPFLCEIE